jgi:hypothetical protein
MSTDPVFDAPAWHLKNKDKWGPEFTARHARTVALLGKRVRVTLDAETVVSGIFLGFGSGGDVEILEADGFVHYCWPMMEIKEDGMPEMPEDDTLPEVQEPAEQAQEPG